MHDSEARRCVYCLQIINADDDTQRVEKRTFAHTACAFAVNDAFFFFDAESEQENDADADAKRA